MFKIILLLLLCLICSSNTSEASISPSAPNCYFKGQVDQISLRKEKGRGLSEGKTHKYIDVTIKMVQINYGKDPIKGCSDESIQILQIHGSILGTIDPSLPKKGSCIKGYSNYSGDGNFMSGNWLNIEETLPHNNCE